jgi:hypothetical protein
VENRIRIVDAANKVGFADQTGRIVIKPQFEMATTFHNGKAIIGERCKEVPGDEEDAEAHASTVCGKHGYINAQGEVMMLGNYTFEEIQKKINWEPAIYLD